MSGKGADTMSGDDGMGKISDAQKQGRICAPPLAGENDDRIAIYFTFDGQVDACLLRKNLPNPIIKIFSLLQLQNSAK